MTQPKSLKFLDFKKNRFLEDLSPFPGQLEYLRDYLEGLEAARVVVEPNYFDRDFLAEYQAFYSTSASSHGNVCQRVHIFSDRDLSAAKLGRLAGLSDPQSAELKQLQDSYLGFIVIRPLPHAPFGRTVLRWYRDRRPHSPRRTETSRTYFVHLCGIRLSIEGIAWQQQDRGVASCATISAWSMLQASAFDDFHFVPTTAEITLNANKTSFKGRRPFPADGGLDIYEISSAIRENDLRAALISGDLDRDFITPCYDYPSFTVAHFASVTSGFLRSKYPLLLFGRLVTDKCPAGELHAVCLVGFREKALQNVLQGKIQLHDQEVDTFYIHDDNLGPNVRFKLDGRKATKKQDPTAILVPEAPEYKSGKEVISRKYEFIPYIALSAVHEGLRTDPIQLFNLGLDLAKDFQRWLQEGQPKNASKADLSLATRVIKLKDYLVDELNRAKNLEPKIRSRIRMSLAQKCEPLGAHVGLIRISSGLYPVLDFICDSTEHEFRILAHISYSDVSDAIVDSHLSMERKCGTRIIGYLPKAKQKNPKKSAKGSR